MPDEKNKDISLSDANRAKLDGIVADMTKNKESEANIMTVVNDFKEKYAEKKKIVPNIQSTSVSENGISGSGSGGLVQPNYNSLGGGQNAPMEGIGVQQQPVIQQQPVVQQNQPLIKETDTIKMVNGVPTFIGDQSQELLPVDESKMKIAPTTQDTTPKDQADYNPEHQKKLRKGELTEAFMRGTATLGAGILRTPAFLYDVGSSIHNAMVPNFIQDKFGYAPSADETAKMLNLPDNEAAKALEEAAKNSAEVMQQKYDKPINEYFAKGEYEKGFEKLAIGISEAVPATIGMILTRGAGATAFGSTMIGGAVFGAQKKAELDADHPEMTNEQKTAIAAGTGLVEGLFEQFGVTKLGGMAKDVLLKEGKEVAFDLAKEGFIKTYGKVAARYLGTAAEEGITEAATQFAQNAIDKYSGVNPELDLMSGVVDAAIIGIGMGTSASAPVALAEVAKTSAARSKAKDLAAQKQTLENDIQTGEVSDEAKSSISNKIKDINEEEAKIASEEKKKFDNLSDEQKQEVNDITNKNKKTEESLKDETISDETREVLEKDIETNEKKVDSIYEETANKKQEQEKVTKEENDQDSVSEIEYLNDVKESVGLTPEEETRLNELQGKKQTSGPQPATNETKGGETKNEYISSLEAKINENKQKYFNEQQSYINYRTENDFLTKQLEDAKNPKYFEDKVKKENRNLPEDQKLIEMKMAKDLDENYEDRREEYLAKNDNVFDTDRARWISEEYSANPALLSQAVHIPAREFVTKVFNEELTKEAPEGKENVVSIVSGGSGAGKTDLVDRFKGGESQLILDTNLSHLEPARKDIEDILAADKDVVIGFVYKNPVKAFIEGVMGGKTRGGRTVPVDVAINANKGSLETIKQLSELYKDNPNVNFQYFDNNGEKGKMKPLTLEDVKALEVDYNKAKEEIQNEIERQYEAGQLTDDQYKGFSGKTELPTKQKVAGTPEASSQEGIGKAEKSSDGSVKKEEKSPPKNKSNGQETKEKEKAPVLKAELIDEEEQADAQKAEDPATLQKMEDDLKVMKSFEKKDMAEKKFLGMVERAWKAKESGKIKKTSYTAFRNKASDVLGGKFNLDKEELKFKSTALFEGIKKKLLGEGYTKILLSSAGPITPKTVADLLDLTNKLVHRGIDAGFTIADATTKALSTIKKHPVYKRLLKSGDLVEKDFENVINTNIVEKFPDAKKEPKAEKKEKPVVEATEDQPITGEKRVKKTAKRLEESEDFKDIIAEMPADEKFYQSIDMKKATKFINETLDKFEAAESLEQLANESMDGKSPFHPKLQNLANYHLADRLRALGKKDGNEMQKSGLNKLAADLMVLRNRNTNIAATQTALEAEVAKLLPLSEEGLKDYTYQTMSQVQDTFLSNKQKKDVQTATAEINAILETEEAQKVIREAVDKEINEMAEKLKGKEWVTRVDKTLDDLKIDLTDC